MNGYLRAGAVCLVALLVIGCVRAANEVGAPSNQPVATKPPASVTFAMQAGTRSVIYAIPAADGHSDGTLYLHSVGSNQSSDVLLGQGTDAVAVPAVASAHAAAHMQWYSTTESKVSVERPSEDTTSTADPGVPLTSLDMEGVRYFQLGDSVVAVQGGATIATYPLPILQPDSSAGDFPPGYKGVYTGVSTGTVSALIPTDTGDVLAFTFTGRAAAVTDLKTKETTQISGYSRLGAGALDASGRIELVAWKAQDEKQNMRLLVLDPSSLAVTSTIDLGSTPAKHLRDMLLPGLGHDAVLAVAAGDDAGVALTIWTVDGSKVRSMGGPPADTGLSIAPADASSVYVYDGPGKNKVGVFDLASQQFTPDVPSLRAPTGSYAVGLLP